MGLGGFFFFFSSRRRHTRWPRDWSSDVCSSDLALIDEIAGAEAAIAASNNNGGFARLMGDGLMAVGTRLMGLGLGMGEIQNIARERFRFGRDKIGAEHMSEIISGTPGLK